jgi:hypothetical protein
MSGFGANGVGSDAVGEGDAARRRNLHTMKWDSWKVYKARDKALQVRFAQLAC